MKTREEAKLELKDIWRKEIQAAAVKGFLLVKNLAFILSTSESKIRRDIEIGRLGVIKMGPEGSRCPFRIPVDSALTYVNNFAEELAD